MKILFFCLFLFSERAFTNFTLQTKNCHENICFPEGYDKHHKPNFGNFAVYVNIKVRRDSRVDQGLKNIDVHQRMLAYSPRIFVAWHDPRIIWNSNKTSVKLDDHMIPEMWTPRITVKTLKQGTKESRYMDYGRTGKCICVIL